MLRRGYARSFEWLVQNLITFAREDLMRARRLSVLRVYLVFFGFSTSLEIEMIFMAHHKQHDRLNGKVIWRIKS